MIDDLGALIKRNIVFILDIANIIREIMMAMQKSTRVGTGKSPNPQRLPKRAVQTRASLSWTGKDTNPPKKGHHFLHIDDFSREELIAMLDTALEVKDKLRRNDSSFKPFEGKSLAMIFTKPSMRTRVSFETVRTDLAVLTHSLACSNPYSGCAGFLPTWWTCSVSGPQRYSIGEA